MDFPGSAPDWRQAIEAKANQLQEYLRVVPDWGNCPVCDKAYPDSLGPHLAGKDHWKKLRWRLDEAPKQIWKTSDGVISFDHVTGDIAFAQSESQLPVKPSTPALTFSAAEAPSNAYAPEPVPPAPFLEQETPLKPAPFLEKEEEPAVKPSAAKPSAERLNLLWSQNRLYCDACGEILSSTAFHKQQQKYSLQVRKCIACTQRATYESSLLQCDQCKKSLERDAFSKSVRNSSQPICRSCKSAMDLEASKMVCRICEQELNRSDFRKKVDWDAPKCASCLSIKEKRAYEQFQREREEEAARQAELREEMAEEQLRENFQQRILGRMSLIKLTPYDLFQDQRKQWASRLMQNILASQDLNHQWRTETPSRDHALDREEADRFKALEDHGDKLFKDLAFSFFEDFVMRQEEEVMTSDTLARSVECRHHSLFLRGRVVACIKAVGSGAKLAKSQLLDVKFQPGWKQISANEQYLLKSLEMELKVKTYPEEIWRDVQDDLYDAAGEDRGSHNQILSRLLSMAGGCAEGSNRTETLNFCADLLGFQSPEDVKYRIWEECFLPRLPGVQRVPIRYGSGKQFKLDKLWAAKKEANCLEALMGALHQGGWQQQCKALAALAALCHLAPPNLQLLVPSNWAMAEKVLANAEKMTANPELFGGDMFLRKLTWRNLDQKRFESQMEQWLGRRATVKEWLG